MARDFYSTYGTEPNMRGEMNSFLDGDYPEITKKTIAVLRKMRDPKEECPCVDAVTHEPDKDNVWCPFCQGEGRYWDETFIDVYKVILQGETSQALNEEMLKGGLLNKPLVVFYTRSSVDVAREDKIIELILDDEGAPVRPYTRKEIYRIGIPVDLRSDHGKLEYWKLTCFAEYRKFLNGPGGS